VVPRTGLNDRTIERDATVPGIIELYQAALAADRLWGAELRRLYGKDAGDARYQTRGEGRPGSTLRDAYVGFRDASAAWRDAVTAARER
jgi:hypothetical protein